MMTGGSIPASRSVALARASVMNQYRYFFAALTSSQLRSRLVEYTQHRLPPLTEVYARHARNRDSVLVLPCCLKWKVKTKWGG